MNDNDIGDGHAWVPRTRAAVERVDGSTGQRPTPLNSNRPIWNSFDRPTVTLGGEAIENIQQRSRQRRHRLTLLLYLREKKTKQSDHGEVAGKDKKVLAMCQQKSVPFDLTLI